LKEFHQSGKHFAGGAGLFSIDFDESAAACCVVDTRLNLLKILGARVDFWINRTRVANRLEFFTCFLRRNALVAGSPFSS
jgi:hypothetical protein